MGDATQYNYELAEIITDAVAMGAIDVGSMEHRVALRVAQNGLKSLDKADRLLFDLRALPALLQSSSDLEKLN